MMFNKRMQASEEQYGINGPVFIIINVVDVCDSRAHIKS